MSERHVQEFADRLIDFFSKTRQGSWNRSEVTKRIRKMYLEHVDEDEMHKRITGTKSDSFAAPMPERITEEAVEALTTPMPDLAKLEEEIKELSDEELTAALKEARERQARHEAHLENERLVAEEIKEEDAE